MKNISRELRKYLYALAITSIPFLVHLGIIEAEASLLILPMIVAVLNLTPKEAKEVQEQYTLDFGHEVEPDEMGDFDPYPDEEAEQPEADASLIEPAIRGKYAE